jgi:hypothetical protein
MKNCINCGEIIHPKRLEILPNTNKCVRCSTAKPKGGVTITRGEGDHTYTETVIMEHDDYVRFQELESIFVSKPFEDITEDDVVVSKDEDTEVEEIPIEGEIKGLSFKEEEE